MMGSRKLLPLLVSVAILILSSCRPSTPVYTATITPLPSQPRVPPTPAALATSSPVPPTTVSPTSTPTQRPTPTQRDYSGLHELAPGALYGDAVGDISIAFLDVIGFEVRVDEVKQSVKAIFTLEDVPEQAEHGKIENSIEYGWKVEVYLDPAGKVSQPGGDISINAFSFTITSFQGETPVSGTPGVATSVPFSQLFSSTSVNLPSGESIGQARVSADPAANTITLEASVPEVTQNSLFSFATSYFDGSMDRPDYSLAGGTAFAPTPVQAGVKAEPGNPVISTALPAVIATGELLPAGVVRAYPGPAHYEGDRLTLEIVTGSGLEAGTEATANISLDGEKPLVVTGTWSFDRLVLPLAVDVTGIEGQHEVRVSNISPGPAVEATYQLLVRPASERAEQEKELKWQSRLLDCCTVYYITRTAAERDIDAISSNIQAAYRDFKAKTGASLSKRMEIYLIDRMWGNGAFGGQGELIVSYYDRNYGPSIGLEGLTTLLKHEFTHAAGVDVGERGIALYNEGLAVFVAGGHYKPEPLHERGAALYQLGYYVAIGNSLSQHELGYLYGGALYQYIADTFGTESVWKFVQKASGPDITVGDHLDQAVRESLDISLASLNQGFEGWLKSIDPGDQLEDLQVTLELQDLRREYQEVYAPPPQFIFGAASDFISHPEFLPTLVREADQPAHVAVELMLAEAQRYAFDGEYGKAHEIIAALKDVMATGQLADPLASKYLGMVDVLEREGYLALSAELSGDSARVEATTNEPEVIELNLNYNHGQWNIAP
ncbi:MAG: hypothetical protein ACM3H7_07335 [Acidobacteriaceae bacterium]